MKITLPYNESTISVQVDESRCAGIVYPNDVPTSDEKALILNSMEHPLGYTHYSEFTEGTEDILVIVNDATRPTPTGRTLGYLSQLIPLERCRFLVATGSHRLPTTDELQWIFGDLYSRLDAHRQIFSHVATDDQDLEYIGKSAAGTEVTVNKLVTQARKILVVTTVEPHYFGGYTGGRKSILPGVAGYETIRQNHQLALDVRAANLALQGNPVHEDMDSCLELLKDTQIFSVQAVLDRHRNIHAVCSGDIRLAFSAAVELANTVFCVEIPARADVVVSVAPYPMDVDLYQSQKAIENAKPALNPGGVIILVSSCRTGIGPETFYRLMSSCESPEDVMDSIREKYKLGYHKAAKMVEANLLGELWAVTDLPDDILKKIFIKPWDNLQNALDAALQLTGENSKVLFIPEGSITVPKTL